MSTKTDAANLALRGKSASKIIEWVFSQQEKTMTTTTFGDRSVALLHMVTCQQPRAKIIWVDTGYNTAATYRFAQQVITALELNIVVYTPEITSMRRNVLMGGIPDPYDPHHLEFIRQVKLEPFRKATADLKPQMWITGIRRDQTEHRKTLKIISESQGGLIKVAPLLNWSAADIDDYLVEHSLPNETDYFDPTKVTESSECGLHTRV